NEDCCGSGACTSLLTTQNCGACGNACAPQHATPTCVGNSCQILKCDTGFGDCDKDPATGCEVDLTTNAQNCGTCGHACKANETCTGSACVVMVNKRVFVTSVMYDGNLGGLAGADAKCQARATAASLSGTYKAWLSDD